MATNYWTDGRVRMARLQGGLLRCNDIVKDFVEVKLSEKLGFAPDRPNFRSIWRQWCKDNHAYIKKYRFWRSQTKEKDDDDVDIPVFEDIDVTFSAYLMQEIVPNHPGIALMKEFRNLMAHGTLDEIDDELDFEDWFRKIENAVDTLFDQLEYRPKRKSWRGILNQIRTEEISALDDITDKFGAMMKAIEAKEGGGKNVAVNVGDVAENVNVHHGDNVTNVNIYVGQENIAQLGDVLKNLRIAPVLHPTQGGIAQMQHPGSSGPKLPESVDGKGPVINKLPQGREPTSQPKSQIKAKSSTGPSIKGVHQRLIKAPPLFEDEWTYEEGNSSERLPATRFPIGVGFIAANLDDRLIIIWGGCQMQKNGRFLRLPKNVVYVFDPRRQTDDRNRWKVAEANGNIHPGYNSAAAVACEKTLYIFGGDAENSETTNALSTLSSDGRFERLRPVGEIPSPRREHRGVCVDGKIFFIGGLVKRVDPSRKDDFVAREDDPGDFYTNEIFMFDPIGNRFSRVSITGARLTPRANCAVATINDSVFIHGGYCNGSLKDFFVFDAKTLAMTKIEDAGVSTGISNHTLTSFSSKYLLLVGGSIPGATANGVKIFDVHKTEWKEEAALSSTIGEGLKCHRAVKVRRDDGVSVIVIGGYIDPSATKHPSYIVSFDVDVIL